MSTQSKKFNASFICWLSCSLCTGQATDEENKLQLSELVKKNAQLQAEVSATKARAIKLDNYTRRENIRLLKKDENCKEILHRIKMEGANKVKFHAVHHTGKQRDDREPHTIITQFVNRETRDDLWYQRKELPTLQIIDMSSWYPTTVHA